MLPVPYVLMNIRHQIQSCVSSSCDIIKSHKLSTFGFVQHWGEAAARAAQGCLLTEWLCFPAAKPHRAGRTKLVEVAFLHRV